MTEPATTTATVGTVALTGAAGIAATMPQLADLMYIMVAAIAGAAVQLSSHSNDGQPHTKAQSAWYLLVTAGMAFALTTGLAKIVEYVVKFDPALTAMPIAFFIGARREWVLRKIVGSVDKALPVTENEATK